MLAEREQYDVTGTLAGDKVRMSIDDGAMAHIMSILTDLYSDPEAAILREYSTNAHDAHIEAGVKRPIEVTTPGTLSPYLVIRDYGVGLTYEDIHDIYSKYGASTKRGTNEQVGMLGLGCKSALTYAAQFTLTSIKDFTKIQVSISRDEDGSGSMTIVDHETTDEGDGTTVTIPAARDNGLDLKARGFFRFWPKGSVLLNGAEPERIDGIQITDKILAVNSSDCDSVIVMGNVAYPVCWMDYGHTLPYGVSMVARVDIGDVNFAPSREALMDTKRTKATLERVWSEWEAGKPTAVQRGVDKAKSASEALATVASWQQRLRVPDHTYKWRGKKLPSAYEVNDSDGKRQSFLVTSNSNYNLGSATTTNNVPASAWPSTVWMHDFTAGSITANHKRKLQAWVADKLPGKRVDQYVFLSGDAPECDFIDAERIVSYEVIKQIEITNTSGNSYVRYSPGHPPGSYDTYVDGEYVRAHGKDIDRTKPIFWVHGNKYCGQNHVRRLLVLYPKHTLVCLPANRIDKFCRIVKEAETAVAGIEAARVAWAGRITDAQKLAITISDSGLKGLYEPMDETRITDPELQKSIIVAKMDVRSLIEEARWFGRPERAAWDNPISNYPLIEHRYGLPRGIAKEHIYVYINAVYAARQEEV